MNIKNERVHQLAREAAAKSGRSQTSVLEEALVRYLAELDGESDPARARRCEAVDRVLAKLDQRLADRDRASLLKASKDLYDHSGLPA